MDWPGWVPLSLPDLRGDVARRTATLVLMAVVISLGVGIFYKVLTLQALLFRPAPATEKTPAAAVPVREPADAYRVIPERNLFGTTTRALTDKQALSVQQDVALLVDLKGTVAGDGRYGFAIVEEKGTRKQRLVRVGDLLAGAKVLRIKRNALDLLVDGQERTIRIVEAAREGFLSPAPGGAAVPLPSASSGPMVVSRSEISAGLQDMGSMLRQAQVRPYVNAGVPDGFTISNIQPGSLYQKMGILDGDIVQGLNNRKIQTADDVVELYNALSSSANMSLRIKRRGNTETLNYHFQ